MREGKRREAKRSQDQMSSCTLPCKGCLYCSPISLTNVAHLVYMSYGLSSSPVGSRWVLAWLHDALDTSTALLQTPSEELLALLGYAMDSLSLYIYIYVSHGRRSRVPLRPPSCARSGARVPHYGTLAHEVQAFRHGHRRQE